MLPLLSVLVILPTAVWCRGCIWRLHHPCPTRSSFCRRRICSERTCDVVWKESRNAACNECTSSCWSLRISKASVTWLSLHANQPPLHWHNNVRHANTYCISTTNDRHTCQIYTRMHAHTYTLVTASWSCRRYHWLFSWNVQWSSFSVIPSPISCRVHAATSSFLTPYPFFLLT